MRWRALLALAAAVSASSPPAPSCLAHRARCLRDGQCGRALDKHRQTCGRNAIDCTASSISDCVHSIRTVRERLGIHPRDPPCTCLPILGSVRECEHFRRSLYYHSCEQRVRDGEEQWRLAGEDYLDGSSSSSFPRRTTRTPMSDQIQQWKKQLSGILETRSAIQTHTCNEALHDVCMKHISCRQLWKLFRQSCSVDASNQCTMTDRDNCWQSFEGLTWTGLGSCQCASDHSDCHWIRLHTTYNKCVFELSKSGEFGSPRPLMPHQITPQFPTATSQAAVTVPTTLVTLPSETREPTSQWWIHGGRTNPPRTQITTVPYRTTGVSKTTARPVTSEVVVDVNQKRNQSGQQSGQVGQGRPKQQTAFHVTASVNRQQATTTTTTTFTTATTPAPVTQRQQPTTSPTRLTPPKQPASVSQSPSPTRLTLQQQREQQQREMQLHHRKIYEQQLEQRRREQAAHPSAQPIEVRGGREQWWASDTPGVHGVHSTRQGKHQHTAAANSNRAGQSGGNRVSPAANHKNATQANKQGQLSGQDGKQESAVQSVHVNSQQAGQGRQTSQYGQQPGQPVSINDRTRYQTDYPQRGEVIQQHRSVLYSPPSLESGRGREAVSGAFSPLHHTARSSCQSAVRRCEAAEECRWHLGELRVRCDPTRCNDDRQPCAQALQRFSAYVPRPLAEALMFCHCAKNDEQCAVDQSLLYPRCLYSSHSAVSCSVVAERCDKDQRCRHARRSMEHSCAVKEGQCVAPRLDGCRAALLSARASQLESPCFCALGDRHCHSTRTMMIPHNPCIERSMLDYSRLMGYDQPVTREEMSSNRIGGSEQSPSSSSSSVGGGGSWGGVAVSLPTDPTADPTVETRADRLSASQPAPKDRVRVVPADAKLQRQGGKKATTTPAPKDVDSALVAAGSMAASAAVASAVAAVKDRERKRGGGRRTSTSTTPLPLEVWEEEEEEEADDLSAIKEKEFNKEFMSIDQLVEEKEEKSGEIETTMSTPPKPSKSGKKGKGSKPFARQKYTTTLAPPKATKDETPPWVTTTTTIPPPTTEYTTYAPPPQEGCHGKDAHGRAVFFHVGSIVRRYADWSGRCSSYCECVAENELVCQSLPCLPEGTCEYEETDIEFGERLYLRERGACACEGGVFVCDTPEEMPELYPGVYLLAGYSLADEALLRTALPKTAANSAGFLAADISYDIASRLQFELEQLLPNDTQCRIVLLSEVSEPGNAFMRVEWFGQNSRLNHTRADWHHGGAEKECSQYAHQLANSFALGEPARLQLLLSTVKQLRVLDTLDGIPNTAPCWTSLALPLLLAILLR